MSDLSHWQGIAQGGDANICYPTGLINIMAEIKFLQLNEIA